MSPLRLTELDHVGIAVRDLGTAVRWYEANFSLKAVHREVLEAEGVEEALLPLGGSWIQLVAPVRPDCSLARFLARRGPGLHHVAYRVGDCAAALLAAKAAGLDLVDEVPRGGSMGSRIGFLHPAGALGTLIELVQR